MKRKLLFIITFLLATTLIKAQNFSIDGINYTITDETNLIVEVSSGSCYDGELTLSETVTNSNITYTITSIGANAFGDFFDACTSLTSIIIPNSITNIGDSAFHNCENLTTVVIGNGLQTIGDYAFRGVVSLASFSIDVIDPIIIGGNYVFNDVNLSTVILEVPDGSEDAYAAAVTWQDFSIYGNFTIDGVNYLITNPNTNTVQIASGSCYDGDLVLTETVMNAGIDYTITSIGKQAFGDYTSANACKTLTSITIPNSVVEIDIAAFYYCENLATVTIGNGLEVIENNAFVNVAALTTFNIDVATPIDITYNYVFSGVDISSVTLNVPDGSESAYAAAGIWQDFSIYGNFTIDGVNYIITDPVNNYAQVASDSCYDGALVLTETVEYANVDYTVTAIRDNAFGYTTQDNCSTLTSIVIPNTVISIGSRAFYYCANLGSISIGNSLQTIGDEAFEGAIALRLFSIDVATPIDITNDNVFGNLDVSIITLQVPEGSEDAYAAANVWQDFSASSNSFTIDGVNYAVTDEENLTIEIVAGSCYDGDLVLSETIENNGVEYTLTSIGEEAFGGFNSVNICNTLTGIVIPDTVVSIGESAFDGCESLTTVAIGNSLESIGEFAFYNNPLTVFSIALETPLEITYFDNIFVNVNLASVNLQVPSGSEAAYSAATVWEDFGTIGVLSASENDLRQNNFNAYVSQSESLLYIKSNSEIKEIGIFDFTGKKLKASVEKIINILDLPSGMYVVKASTTQGMATKKVLKN